MGAAVARAFTAAGARVVVAARSRGEGEVAGQFVAADLSTPQGPRELAEAAVSLLGGVDVLIDNVASQTRVPTGALNLSDQDWLTDLAGTLLSAVRLDRELLPAMVARGSGVVVHIGSNAARWPQPAALAYAAAKAALTAYSKGLAGEVGRSGVRVNVVAPGILETTGLARRLDVLAHEGAVDLETARRSLSAQFAIPLGRPGTPEEAAELVLFLASSRARYLTGSVFTVDGGLLPTL